MIRTLRLRIFLTNACIFQCKHCFVSPVPPFRAEIMPVSLLENMVDLLLKNMNKPDDVKLIVELTGGEPLILPANYLENVLKVVSYLDPFRTGILTSLCVSDFYEKITILRRYGVNYFFTSYDPFIRFSDSSQIKHWENFVRFLTAEGAKVQINTIVTKYLMDGTCDIMNLLRYFRELNPYCVSLGELALLGNAKKNREELYVSPEEYFQFMKETFNRYFFCNVVSGDFFVVQPFADLIIRYFTGMSTVQSFVLSFTLMYDGVFYLSAGRAVVKQGRLGEVSVNKLSDIISNQLKFIARQFIDSETGPCRYAKFCKIFKDVCSPSSYPPSFVDSCRDFFESSFTLIHEYYEKSKEFAFKISDFFRDEI